MSWIDKLCRTYESNSDVIGLRGDAVPLLPMFHTTKKHAHVEITLDGSGNFRRAAAIPVDQAKTILPATENSAGRTSGCAPHPLADQLQYIAADYKAYGGSKKSYFNGSKNKQGKYTTGYVDLLKMWTESKYSNDKVKSVFLYVSKGTLIGDLVQNKVLFADSSGQLLKSWVGDKKERPDVFGVFEQGKNQSDTFVRWRVEVPGDCSSELQYDSSVWNDWIQYYLSTRTEKSMCFVTGEELTLAEQNPRMIRSDGDGAKLISSNDASGFTYLGRFTEDAQACGVSAETTQKAHNALRWLIARQGYVDSVKDPSLAIVSWAVSGSDVPNVLNNTFSLFGDDEDEDPVVNTAQQFGVQLTRRIAGYSARLGETDEIVVMGLDSATPGRMAITFYRELTGSEFLKRIESWHRSCCWFQNYGKDTQFIGAPSPNDIAKAAYGKDVDDKLKRATIARLLPCIVDEMPLPKDLLASCFHNAVRRNAFDRWEWEKILGITCALYKKYNEEMEDHTMALDRTRMTRDYLYGRLLAVGDGIEGFALGLSGEKRPTNAARLMQRFADHPCSTWKNIELALTPYKSRLGGRIKKYQGEQDEIMNLFEADEFTDDRKPLSGEFLLGFHCQRTVLVKSDNE